MLILIAGPLLGTHGLNEGGIYAAPPVELEVSLVQGRDIYRPVEFSLRIEVRSLF
jgi:hypothetical protein